MRPERLEMSGFAPFRDRTEVDFRNLELFALTGPTGAGKSSVIDALTFALYGSVARYDRRSVGPIISLGAAEARIRFDFTVEGTPYTAARVVRRTAAGGATTAEARLESDGQVLASGAAEVTAAVERLLGLAIDHFTRSVVLPQGEFAAFLHDTPAGQQDLVKALLDMGLLDTVRKSATERAKTAEALADQARTRRDDLSDATEEAEKEAGARLARLEQLVEAVTSAEEAIDEAQEAAKAKATEVETLENQARLVAAVRIPEGLTDLAEKLASLKAEVAKSEKQVARAEEALATVTTEAEALPSAESLETASSLIIDLSEARQRRDAIDLERLAAERTDAEKRLSELQKVCDAARKALEDARSRHAAHALTKGLVAGDPCPVCRQPLLEGPGDPPADLGEGEAALEAAEKALDRARTLHRQAEAAAAEGRVGHQAASATVSQIESRLSGLPQGEALSEAITARAAVDQRMTDAREQLKVARQDFALVREAVSELENAEKQAWYDFSELRDRVAALGPPAAERDDLGEAWRRLLGWAQATQVSIAEQLTQAVAAAEDAAAAVQKQTDEVEQLLEDAHVSGQGRPTTRLAAAVAMANAEHDRIRERRGEREAAQTQLNEFTEKAAVATALANHMKANRFEGWLLSEALAGLVDGANTLLADLTSGCYSLALQERSIEVVDHRNADEHRSVRSLSGGETFLVSLALALSLGEQLTNLSERGGARLEAIFLDEGFGSLDAATLETVSVVVTELASQGRIVGVVTHVKELAEQIPTRFEVRTGPAGSTVERVEQ
ncbi:MAG TPA: SMC family ATPase [Acidimicrobiia bacterium]|nr:SMC family ATPase [Acidimicrobiia bacterium]